MKSFYKTVIIFLIMFVGTSLTMAVDSICEETTGAGGKLVLHLDKFWDFH